jgi:hypothetical protein
VERDFLYTDLENGVLIGCFPQTRRGELSSLEEDLVRTWTETVKQEMPRTLQASMAGPGPRIVFGLAELREKVICFDAKLDDRLVEAMKLALLEGLPGREAAGVADLALVAAHPDSEVLAFQPLDADRMAVGEHLLEAPVAMYGDFWATRDNVKTLLPGLFEGLWVHHSRSRAGQHLAQ